MKHVLNPLLIGLCIAVIWVMGGCASPESRSAQVRKNDRIPDASAQLQYRRDLPETLTRNPSSTASTLSQTLSAADNAKAQNLEAAMIKSIPAADFTKTVPAPVSNDIHRQMELTRRIP
jgi:hypothetical protein